ncbi:MAG: transporter substrate-binding domain-containing protein [Candidatus Riflebacteria bacterium]|nr:transporter substrate-binding domain-containing protein [Candidatus Riflebacteria bacterium]
MSCKNMGFSRPSEKFVLLFFFFLLINAFSLCAKPLIFGEDIDYPPYSFLDENNVPAGYNIDLTKAVASAAGFQCEIKLGKWTDVKQDLRDGMIDAIGGMVFSPERAKEFDFSIRHLANQYDLFIRKGDQGAILSDLSGKEIVVQNGDIGHEFLVSMNFPGKLILTDTVPDALRLIESGKHFGALLTRAQGYYLVKTLKLKNLKPAGIDMMSLSYCMAVKRGNEKLVSQLNSALLSLKHSGAYQEIYDKWFGIYEEETVLQKIVHHLSYYSIPLSISVLFVFFWLIMSHYRLIRINRSLAESETRNRALLVAIPDLMFLFSEDLRFLECNADESKDTSFYKSPKDFLGKKVRDVLPPMLVPLTEEKVYSVISTGREEKYEYSLEMHNQHREFESRVVPCGKNRALAIVRDITERRNFEKRLSEKEQHFQIALEATHSSSFEILMRDSVFTASNSVFAKLGYETVPRSLEEFFGLLCDLDKQKCIDCVKKQYSPEEPIFYHEFRLCDSSGRLIWHSASGKATEWDVNGCPTRLIGLITDISERKKAEDSRLEMERRLLHSQKLESLGVLAGGIAHDFNNLLTAILGNLDLAKLDISISSPAYPSITAATKASMRAADLTRQLLAYSGKGKFLNKLVNLSELVNEMAHLMRTSMSRSISLSMQLKSDILPIRADPSQVQQIIMNLIVNASEAIGKNNGHISISTGVQYCDSSYLAKSSCKEKAKAGEFVYLEVNDDGCGMDENTKSRLFDPFFTTKFTGRGLGMSAVLGIMNAQHGAIIVYSEVGKGSTFKVLFPSISHEEASKEKGSSDSGKRKAVSLKFAGKILVVDDEEAVAFVCQNYLKKMGIVSEIARDGLEALEMFSSSPDEYKCIILDLTMPKMDGTIVFSKVRQIKPDLKVILSSGYNQQEATQRFTGKGLAGFIQKPFQLEALRDILQKVFIFSKD